MTVDEARAGERGTRNATGGTAAIEDYGVIGDCRSAALISNQGCIDWMCWPRFDSPPLFSRLLDSRGGSFVVEPRGPYRSRQEYVAHSNTLRTFFDTSAGRLTLTDTFYADSEANKRHQLLPQSMLIRRWEAEGAPIDVDAFCAPMRGFSLGTLKVRQRGPNSFTFPVEDGVGHLSSDFALDLSAGAIRGSCAVRPGEPRTLLLSWNESGPAVFPPLGSAMQLIEASNSYWRSWAGRITYDGPYADAVERSALALKLMTFSPSGAIIAAPTSSLPEKLGESYNWDYRFCWLRDASFTIRAFYGLGLQEEAQAFMQWMLHATHLTLPRLQVMYSVFGKAHLPESEHADLEGYRASRPVRTGNGAYVQTQLDIYGEVMHAAVMAREQGTEFSGDERAFLQHLAHYVEKHWFEPDNGIWESRSDFTHHVHSRVMCWLAMDNAAKLARDGALSLDAARCERVAAAIKQDVQTRGFHPARGHYTASYESIAVDSALLTLPILGFEDVKSPRIAATINAIRNELGVGNLLYRHERGKARLEGAFLLSCFWLVECLVLQGQVDEARQLFEHLLGLATGLGLYAEEIDPDTSAFLGNFPQGFSHIGLINAALALNGATSNDRGVK